MSRKIDIEDLIAKKGLRQIDNVANKRYWASAFDTFSTALLQGQPRTLKASISTDF